jgi:hypothetical protein
VLNSATVPVTVLFAKLIVLLVSVAVAVRSVLVADDAAVVAKAVVAICVVLVPPAAVGAAGVPVNVGDAVSALVEIAVAMLLYSVSISVPLIILAGLPVSSASFAAKSLDFT